MQIGVQKKRKSGYAQFGSNQATYTQQLLMVLKVVHGKVSYHYIFRANLCRDNITFYRKNYAFPVLDQDVKLTRIILFSHYLIYK